MKKIIQINNNNYGSTGKIMQSISAVAIDGGFDCYTSCKNSREGKKFNNKNQILIGIWLERIISERLAYFTSLKDSFNIFGTLLFINKLKKIKPDLIHFHNLHGSFINITILFSYIKKNNIPIVWTFHDSWSYTGQCTDYDCEKWKTGCSMCPKLHQYPSVFFLDLTRVMWKKKKRIFNGINNLTIVTPSKWMNELVGYSYLKNYRRVVINNGIDLSIFKPTKSNIRERYSISENDFILLGVANYWNNDKGLDVFVEIAEKLPRTYKIILVGTNENVDKKIPDNILSIHHTYDIKELIEIYSSADLFLNPTRRDNFPTVDIEAIACGTPVLSFDTGGSSEILNEKCGSVVRTNDINSFISEIYRICETRPFSKDDCVKRAKCFDLKATYSKYLDLYKEILKVYE